MAGNDGQTKVSVLCSLFTWMQRSKTAAKKRSKFRKYLDVFCNSGDYFASLRLILPSLDRERGSYGLKESVLATSLIDALAISRDSQDALRLINWRKGGPKSGSNAGNFALVAAEVLQQRQGMTSGGLTIKELNELLDQLVLSENRAEKTSVLSTLIKKTNSQEMKWIVMIILKDLKLGISEKSIFHEFHPDAEDLFNVTCDLRLVCEKLKDRSQRHKRQDIEVGKAVRPQLALRVADATAAWKKLHGKEVIVECKFDGDRIQIHKNGTEIHFFSRNFLDHTEYSPAMSDIIIHNILVERCILDGEMLVWDTSLNRFSEFGSNQEIAKAAKDGHDTGRQLCYVAFDVLYVGDTSVIHQSLKERHELLRRVVKPLKGSLDILVPNGGLNALCSSGVPRWSLIAYNVDDIEKFFKETIENREEGIVLKDLASKWEPSDRSGKWLKLKPDYIHSGCDLDVLIIGGYYGSGRHGGEVAQFLVGLAERPTRNTYPTRFVSFCRVGSGLSDEELDAIVTKLRPYFRKYDYPKKPAPRFYHITNNSKERPDVWIDNPEKSIVLSITSDIRTISSEVFASPYSLRFPRIDRVRYDKPWHECLDVQSFVELVHSSNGTTQRGTDSGGMHDNRLDHIKSSRKGVKKDVTVPSHFIHTDVSDIKGESLIFSGLMYYFVNVPPTHSIDALHKMVVENGGSFSMNLNNSVTHCVAAENKGFKYQAAKLRGNIIHCSWFLDCCSEKKLLPLHPKFFLFLSDASKKKLQEDIDDFSDSYYWDIDDADIKHLLSNMNQPKDSLTVNCYKKKYCPKDKWSTFHGCCIYFHSATLSHKRDVIEDMLLELAIRRMKLEVSMGGGTVTYNLFHATHFLVFSRSSFDIDYNTLLRSFTAREQPLLCNGRLLILSYQWLEDCLLMEHKLQEETYSLRPKGLEESFIEECKDEVVSQGPTSLGGVVDHYTALSAAKATERMSPRAASEDQRKADSLKRDITKRKGGKQPSGITTKGGTGVSQPRRTRARLGNKAAKIYENELDRDLSPYEDKTKVKEGNYEITGREVGKESEIHESDMVKNIRSSFHRNMTTEVEVAEDAEGAQWLDGPCGVGLDGKSYGQESETAYTVQAMLLNMIPSLGMGKTETTKPVIDCEKPQLELKIPRMAMDKTETTKPVLQHEKPMLDPSAVPMKKKKVSYKDIASSLLKD